MKVLGLERSATLSTNNLEGFNRAGNVRDGIGIEHPLQRYHRKIWRHSTTAGRDISKRAVYQWVLALCKVLDQVFVVLASF